MMKLVIVESPAKARSIGKYLGSDYTVLASYGHVRDLPSKNHSVRPEEDFALTWEVIEKAEPALKNIRSAVKKADELILATDPDREGEAISWHVLEYLKSVGLLGKAEVKRVAFNAVTKSAVLEALKTPRKINQELVEAYLARLSLDYLVGFTLSPILWRKLPGSRSAGRVQSVALRLIVEREREIEAFQSKEYWTIEGLFGSSKEALFSACMSHFKGKKLEKFSFQKESEARSAVSAALKCAYHVSSIEKKRVKRSPQPPFTTSTLQQEASRKLGLSASKTMQIAQKLYEGIDLGKGEITGLITYMRTDSVQVIPEALKECQDCIRKEFGDRYLSPEVRIYKTKAKNAQEAHEAIRPTNFSNSPKEVKNALDPMQYRLYELIWKRMLASQMSSAEFDQVGVDLASEDLKIIFRATGSTLAFDGFLKIYQESKDDNENEDDAEKRLPPLEENQKLLCQEIQPYQHFTQPPPRYTEASLVKKMEELGIGRPSTYARILQVLQDRDYVKLEKKKMVPQERGRIVTAFLTHFFEKYVQYGFTADLEGQLDDISAGSVPWKDVLHKFWDIFHQTVKESEKLTITQVLETLEKDLESYLFPEKEGEGEASSRLCPRCKKNDLGLRLGKFGAFLGCSNYPTCSFTRPIQPGEEGASSLLDTAAAKNAEPHASSFPRVLGTDPQTGLVISVRLGPYGPYFQFGEDPKPKRISLPKGLAVDCATLEQALELGKLPRQVGVYPETGGTITAGIGRFGPFIKHENRFISLKKDDNVFTISLERAIELIQKAPPKAPTRTSTKASKPAPAQGFAQETAKGGATQGTGKGVGKTKKGAAKETIKGAARPAASKEKKTKLKEKE